MSASERLPSTPTSDGAESKKRNAFEQMMKPDPKKPRVAQQLSKTSSASRRNPRLSGLLPYITKPETFPAGTIIRRTEHTVLIRDLYPKALVHLLLLPLQPRYYDLTPFDAFNHHQDFLELMKTEAASAAKLAASELSRLVSPTSRTEMIRRAALDDNVASEELPEARDFLSHIKIGVHAEPSMSTLHVHLVSIDNTSPSLKTKKHYNSFNTKFFIPLDDFPLMEEDKRMDTIEQQSLLKGDMTCWRCHKNFGNKFTVLKNHLEEEYREWKTE